MAAIRHPARHFIHYLLSRRIYNAKGVIQELSEFGLPVPKNLHEKSKEETPFFREDTDSDFYVLCQEILKARTEMVFPEDFEPQRRRCNEATAALLKKWKITGIWRNDSPVVTAIELLSEPQIRSSLELLLLSPLSLSAIAHRMCIRYDLDPRVMNAAVVRAFSHYFWDPHAMDNTHWRLFVSAHRQNADEYHAMLQAPRSSAGAAFAIAIVDRDPQLLSAVDRYEAASAMAFSMLMRQAISTKTGAPYAAFTALNMMRLADDELEKHRGGSSELLAELQRMRTLLDQQRPMAITDAPYIQRPVLMAKNPEDPPDGK